MRVQDRLRSITLGKGREALIPAGEVYVASAFSGGRYFARLSLGHGDFHSLGEFSTYGEAADAAHDAINNPTYEP